MPEKKWPGTPAAMHGFCITGGIACGKTTVGRLFADLGFTVLEADAVCHELMRPGRPVHAKIARMFGARILRRDGTIDRARLGGLVFRDPELLRGLNALVHPAARATIRRRCARMRVPAVIVPLLYESGWDADWPTVVCVAAPRELQLARLAARGLRAADARRRLAAQLPVEDKMRRADYVIFNSGTMEILRQQVSCLAPRLSDKQEK